MRLINYLTGLSKNFSIIIVSKNNEIDSSNIKMIKILFKFNYGFNKAFNRIFVLFILLLKMTKLFHILASRVLEANNNEVVKDSNYGRADETVKISTKLKIIKKLLKTKKFKNFRIIYFFKL